MKKSLQEIPTDCLPLIYSMPLSSRAPTAEQIKLIEGIAAREYGIEHRALMENAGRVLAQIILGLLQQEGQRFESSRISIVVGAGNNGADGLICARHLLNYGVEVKVLLVRDLDGPLETSDPGRELRFLKVQGLEPVLIKPHFAEETIAPLFMGADMIVDAMVGLGLSSIGGTLRSPIDKVIYVINDLEIPVISVDIPSGLDSNTGALVKCAVEADLTVTFTCPKAGMIQNMGPHQCGKILVADVGIPRHLVENLPEGSGEETPS